MFSGEPTASFVGFCTVDLALEVPRLPKEGETILASATHLYSAGVAANEAVQFARLGGDARLISAVGDDGFGDFVLRSVESTGVAIDGVAVRADFPTGLGVVLLDGRRDNRIIVSVGSNSAINDSLIRQNERSIRESSAVVVEMQIGLEPCRSTVDVCRRVGVPVVLALSPVFDVPESVMRHVGLVVLNRVEAGQLLGLEEPTPADMSKLSSLQGWRAPVVVTMGEEGAVVVECGECDRVPALPANVVDTTGAGDSFLAALVLKWVTGSTLREAAAFANVAAALAISRPGAQNVPDLVEVSAALVDGTKDVGV